MAHNLDTDVLIQLENKDEEEDLELLQAKGEAEARRTAEAAAAVSPDAEPPELTDGKTHHLFISHSEEDIEWASQLVETLEQEHGLKCLWPKRDFTPGHEIPKMIQSGIAHSVKVLFVITQASLDSGWCKYERNWAFVLSVEERANRVIPLLLSPCDMPNIFKTINYIDVPKGEDHIYRILRSFDQENDLMDIVPNLDNFWKKQVNGLKREIHGEKCHRSMFRGPAWWFPPLDDYQRYSLRKLGSKFADDVYNDIRELVNATPHMKRYGIRNSCSHCVAFWFFSVATTLSFFSVIISIAEMSSESTKNQVLNLIIAQSILVPVIIPIAIVHLEKWALLSTQKLVAEYNLSHVLDTKLLVTYKRQKYHSPILIIMYYDIQPCVNYIRIELLRIRTFRDKEDMETRKDMAQKSAQRTVLDYIRRSHVHISDWDQVEISEVNRHPTFANKKCLCEILDRTYWSAERMIKHC